MVLPSMKTKQHEVVAALPEITGITTKEQKRRNIDMTR